MSHPWNAHDYFAHHEVLGDAVGVADPMVYILLGSSRPIVSVSVTFSSEVQGSVDFLFRNYSVDNQYVLVVRSMEDDYVAVWVICVEVFRIYALNNYQISDM